MRFATVIAAVLSASFTAHAGAADRFAATVTYGSSSEPPSPTRCWVPAQRVWDGAYYVHVPGYWQEVPPAACAPADQPVIYQPAPSPVICRPVVRPTVVCQPLHHHHRPTSVVVVERPSPVCAPPARPGISISIGLGHRHGHGYGYGHRHGHGHGHRHGHRHDHGHGHRHGRR